MILSLIAGFVLGIAALLFAVQNIQAVALTFLNWQFETSLAVVVLTSILLGILISLLASLPSALSDHFRIKRLRKENEYLAEEVDAHRQAAQAAAPPTPPATVDLRQ